MSRALDILLTDLRHLISSLGHDGGLMGPSIYDTARVICLAPMAEPSWPALEWLLEQQHRDGGWEDSTTPHARDLPTLAAILALHRYGRRRSARDACKRGLQMLQRQANYWHGPLPLDLTSGLELLLPPLLKEAAELGLKVDSEPYGNLMSQGARKRQIIAESRPGVGAPAVHSWEGWGVEPEPGLQDSFGSIGHSPAATAAWLQAAVGRPELAEARARAKEYLRGANRATQTGLPLVMPTCWPIEHFERIFALHALHLGGLLHHQGLADVIPPQIDLIAQAYGPNGIGTTEHFAPDGDDTAAALALLHSMGRPAAFEALELFANGDHFCAWQRELQPSLSVTAHATQALALLGKDTTPFTDFLVRHQLPDGRWACDKWNRSWVYTTWRVLVALRPTARADAVRKGLRALLAFQNADGGWGTGSSNPEETAYGVLALRSFNGNAEAYHIPYEALARGDRWLSEHYAPFMLNPRACWLAKQAYKPNRIARAVELVALISGLAESQ